MSRLTLVTEHWRPKVIPICSNDDSRLTFVRHSQICVTMHMNGENIENLVSQNALKTNG